MKPLRILFIEDIEDDRVLLARHLERAGYALESERVDSAAALRRALASGTWDAVLSDYNLPGFSAHAGLELVRGSGQPDLPFLVVSGSIGEEAAIGILQLGASDFILKDALPRLVPALERSIAEARLRRERRDAQTALASALATRDDLIAVTGHELRNPLTALQLTIDSLARSGRSPEHAAALARHATRLRVLVARSLDVAAINAGMFALRLEKVDLGRVVGLVVDRTAQPDRFVRSGAPGVSVQADPARLELALGELVDNAAKFARGAPIEVTTGVGEAAWVEVADRGPGLGALELAEVGRPFRKGVPTANYGGYGLGLWLARTVLEAHGGSLSVGPRQGGGVVALARLPLGVAATPRA